ncbi:Ferredoxin-thioredoxin reductase, catalytic subunit [Methanoculleus chikugoensis]|jgi:ferredoxin-thioredoxin reductase catalytic chain|uniref:ferredoxin:thioredoxin reductase n=1 Tax=Methanoculleus chikugoensis TaxID=118126 RepID=A0A1M4MHC0_9EURY|nr:ferredoxin-thioredoxin reductase catalytic domain-containing protein [Methanoculleus chikugoensis]MDD4568134.1 ferredoxin-thioredoxin reductase catalytic domain-containing protein [Methanoculleus chikugoensis]NMA11291.1 ferredoxin:thioredoxin reductase [Methanomicrobiales archaeon]SCL74301.1 Ferredoxin-thioredoxin reductase, catalytic subunit [Methanoculleus chikugoensis]
MSEEGIEEARTRAKVYAKEKGFILNVDEKQLDAVLRGLARNKERFGEAYCPCRLRSGDPEKDRIIVCPCIYHENEIEEQGTCHCRLFFKKGE